MYNLIITSSPRYWEQSPKTFILNRLFEYTHDLLRERFVSLDGTALQELLGLPTLFAYEDANREDARIGRIFELRRRQKEVRIDFELNKDLPSISFSDLKRLDWELDIGEWEYNRTHWAVKEVDLFHELTKAGIFSEEQATMAASKFDNVYPKKNYPINPSIFRVPEGGVEQDLVSVMRPFDAKFDRVQAILKDSCEDLKLRCLDANEIWNESEIIQDIFSLIYRSSVVICDFSGRNANVFYEAGIAHTIGRTVIPIVQNEEHIPFDLHHHRYVKYLPNDEGLAKLGEDVSRRLRTLFSG